jgi:DNA repair protein RecO (recombination protein O)
MELIDDDALVLDGQPYRDRDMLVTLLTRDTGLMRGVLRRARGGKAPQAAAVQVLSLIHVTGHLRPGADLATFRQVDLVTSSYPLAADLERATAAAVIAETLITFCPIEEPAPRRFRLGHSLLEGLIGGTDPHTAVAYAQYWALALGGVLPEPDRDQLDARDLRFLAACREEPVSSINGTAPERVRRWLDLLVHAEAERPLRALDFFLSLGSR